MKAIVAAAIIALGLISSVLIYEHAENARIERRELQAQCEKARAALDNCTTFFTEPVSQGRCRAGWQADVSEKCYGIKAPVVADKDLFK
jgi:hypothetical protein